MVGQLGGQLAPTQRADAQRAPARRLRRHLEDRVLHVQAAAHVDPLVGALQRPVARRLPFLDQPVLQHQRAELGVRGLVVHHLGPLGPAGGRREVRPRARAQGHRLADVERPAALVAEHVHARVLGQRGEIGALLARDRGAWSTLGLAAPSWRAAKLHRVADRGSVHAEALEQRAQHTRAGLGIRQRPVHGLHLDPERVGQRGQPAPPNQRRQLARQPDGAQHGRVGPVEAGAFERLCQHPAVERGVVRHQHAALHQPRQLGQHLGGRRSPVHHRLADPGEALDPARERHLHAHQRLPAVMELAPAHEHGAHLGHLAQVAGAPIGLGVDAQQLR